MSRPAGPVSLRRDLRGRLAGARGINGERRLVEPLLGWLQHVGRINAHTRVVLELPWLGRRVDLATLTTTRRTAAYELKLTGLGRALEQATYNRLAFDRSYIVTASIPRRENVELAAHYGIGLIVVRGENVQRLLESPAEKPLPELRARLLAKLNASERWFGV